MHNVLGMIGFPMELRSSFPSAVGVILLTESAKSDPNVIASLKARLEAGKTVVITSGLPHALEGKGIEDLVELRTGMHEEVTSFIGALAPVPELPWGRPGSRSYFHRSGF